MRTDSRREEELFETARKEPVEISLEQVDKMVAGFPLMPTPFDWSSIINLNTIIMSSVATFILAGSFMLLSGNAESEGLQQRSYQIIPDSTIEKEPEQSPNQDESAAAPLAEADQDQDLEESPAEEPSPEATPEPETLSVMMPLILPIEEAEPVSEESEEPEMPELAEEIEVEFIEEAEEKLSPPVPVTIPGQKEFSVGEFESVGLSGSFNMEIKQGNNFKVWATGDESKLEKLEVTEKNGHLKVKTKKKNYKGYNDCSSKTSGITVYVVMPTFKSMHVAGSGTLTIGDFDNLEDVDLHIAGSGSIEATGDLRISGSSEYHIAGSGDMNIDGNSPKVEIHIAGSGDFNGADLNADIVEIHIAGSGDVAIHADQELDVSIAGSGDITYTGDARLKKSIAGSGDIHHH